MQVTVTIPDSLIRYIEYVPKDKLSEMLIQALEDKIKTGSARKVDENEAKYEEILSILSRMQQNVPLMMQEHLMPTQEEVEGAGEVKEAVIINFQDVESSDEVEFKEEDDDDDEMFDDLMK